MKIRKTTLAERQRYKFLKAWEAKKEILSSQKPIKELVWSDPTLFIREQKFNRAFNPELAEKAFKITQADVALNSVRRVLGHLSVTKAVQRFFDSPRGQQMREVQDAFMIANMDSKENFKEYLRPIKADIRKNTPSKDKKNWS